MLQLPKAPGGLALPYFLHYYWSCDTHKLLYWINNTVDDLRPTWVDS